MFIIQLNENPGDFIEIKRLNERIIIIIIIIIKVIDLKRV